MKCSLIGNWSGGSSLSNCEAFGPYNEKAGRCTSNADSDIKAKTQINFHVHIQQFALLQTKVHYRLNSIINRADLFWTSDKASFGNKHQIYSPQHLHNSSVISTSYITQHGIGSSNITRKAQKTDRCCLNVIRLYHTPNYIGAYSTQQRITDPGVWHL